MLRQSLAKVKGNGKTELQGRAQEFLMRQRERGLPLMTLGGEGTVLKRSQEESLRYFISQY